MSNLNHQHQYFESQISQHWLLSSLRLLIMVAALFVVYFLDFFVWAKGLIAISVIGGTFFVWRVKKENPFRRLIYEQHVWFVLDKQDVRTEYTLEKLSKVLNLAYVLNLRGHSASDSTQLIIWKRDLSDGFARFLAQTYQVGLPNKE